jgi:hypothetical protein
MVLRINRSNVPCGNSIRAFAMFVFPFTLPFRFYNTSYLPLVSKRKGSGIQLIPRTEPPSVPRGPSVASGGTAPTGTTSLMSKLFWIVQVRS